ncbi:hypothetical protein TRFO_01455 [Tritrichomonas foetus]|uniref:Uncharacterized protein n=1 Tax=Tritrichomonas foetus TaxID=1144522 RepID=A0A1J4JXR7_9EUKA|nr:hypothetical protein TRFO_01455 [Tritrichomonas foetus]|eukprot:OHT03787.1 hypothetical protein TRFO_01455 [Tritrichomonas foetus]
MNEQCAPTRELHWGIKHIADIQPQKRRFAAFTSINENLFASSDGTNVYFWNPNGVTKVIDLPAIALFYIKQNNHIIASIKNSTHFHFIWLHEPYSVIVHPLAFSLKTMTSLFYLPKSETLITAGQGITFSKMIIPRVPEEGACSQLIEFKRYAELYTEEIFTKVTPPLFIEEEDSVAVPIKNSLFVHSYDGTLIGSMKDLTKGNITCLSYFKDNRKIVVGDEFGNVLFVDYGAFYSKTTTNLANNTHLLMASLFDKYFLITVGLDKTLNLINLKNEHCLQTINLKSEIITVRVEQNIVFLFTHLECYLFKVSIFTKFLANTTANALKMERYLLPKKPAKIICYQTDSLISTFTAKTGDKILELRSSSLGNEIADYLIENDQVFLRFQKGDYLLFSLNNKKNIITLSNSNNTNDNTLAIRVPPSVNNVMQIIKYANDKNGSCLLSITSSGHIYSFSVDNKILISSTYVGCSGIICGIYASDYKVFYISTKKYIIVLDSISLTVKNRIPKECVTTFQIYETYLITGDSNGVIEVWELPTVKLLHRSTDYNAFHSSNGLRKPISEYKSLSDIPYAVKYIDYLPSRNIILSVSNTGEIFLFTTNCFPYAHLNFSFDVSAACFYDNNGSILMSSFESLFVIDYSYFFEMPAKVLSLEVSELDEFNTFEVKKKNHVKSITNDYKPNESSTNRFQQKLNSAKDRKKIDKYYFDKFKEVETELINTNNSLDDENISQSFGFETNPNEPIFVDLIVEEEIIPKRHFVCSKAIVKAQETQTKENHFKIKPTLESLKDLTPAVPSSTANPKRAPRNKNSVKKTKKKPKKNFLPKDTKRTQLQNQNSQKQQPQPPKQTQINSARRSITKKLNKSRNTSDSAASLRKNSNNKSTQHELGSKPPFYVEVNHPNFDDLPNVKTNEELNEYLFNKKLNNDNENENSNENNNLSQNDFDEQQLGQNDINGGNDDEMNRNRNNANDDEDIKKSKYRPQNTLFIDPRQSYGKIPTVTMEELDNYMANNTVFLKNSSKKKRSNSLRRYKPQESMRNVVKRDDRTKFLKISKVPRQQSVKRIYSDNLF